MLAVSNGTPSSRVRINKESPDQEFVYVRLETRVCAEKTEAKELISGSPLSNTASEEPKYGM
jgi:hypothetical protein